MQNQIIDYFEGLKIGNCAIFNPKLSLLLLFFKKKYRSYRFGSTSEIGVYCMEANGLIDVLNPSELFMSRAVFNEGLNGAAILILM